MPENYTIAELSDLRARIAEVARNHRERMAAMGIDINAGEDQDEDEDGWTEHIEEGNPRQKGDDDGQEYGHPGDELEERRSER